VKVYTFIADSAPEAVAQIKARLGPEAVVINVRKLEADGLQKFWKKAQIEVIAHVPEPEAPAKPKVDALQALSELRREIADLKQQFPKEAVVAPEPVAIVQNVPLVQVPPVEVQKSRHNYGRWKVGAFLEQTGVLPVHVQRIVDELEAKFGEEPPTTLAKEFDLVRAVVIEKSQRLLTSSPTNGTSCTNVHIFVGSPGSGKTTVLSKMLARHVLMDGLPARVLRFDGLRANTAESLSVYCEILGVPVERCLTPETSIAPGETVFVDLPGVSASDAEGLKALAAQLKNFPGAQLHLTLNAAYETTTLLQQARAYSFLPISSLTFTHLDEELRWGKLLNFWFGTKFSLGQLSAGQNVPGDLFPATAEKILARVIPSK
jgi:flagellar biosynthesis protein FlhF